MTLPVITLLGRKDEPTDAVEEYCRYLGSALLAHEIEVQIRRVPWELHGWREALHGLKLQASHWRGRWVLVQYTALAWSARGFPFRFLHVLQILRAAGARIGIVFHDVEPFSSPRPVDRLRCRIQVLVMRRALQRCALSVFTVVPERLSWLNTVPPGAYFIPVGPNLPFPGTQSARSPAEIPVIGVFSITGGRQGFVETQTIIQAVRQASRRLGKLRLVVFGRHSELREEALRQGLSDCPVQLSVEGILEPAVVVSRFAECDVLLFVRKGISTRRSSAIAGIAAAVPMVACQDGETGPPVTDAGVILVDPGSPELLGDALVRVLSTPTLKEELAARSRAAYATHFSWSSIAAKYAAALRSDQV
jgi:glycosyltransferase involved in cell wall biosynthesis